MSQMIVPYPVPHISYICSHSFTELLLSMLCIPGGWGFETRDEYRPCFRLWELTVCVCVCVCCLCVYFFKGGGVLCSTCFSESLTLSENFVFASSFFDYTCQGDTCKHKVFRLSFHSLSPWSLLWSFQAEESLSLRVLGTYSSTFSIFISFALDLSSAQGCPSACSSLWQ